MQLIGVNERNHRPLNKLHQPWIDDCVAQASSALSLVDSIIEPGKPHMLFGRLTHADVAAFVAERLARAIGIDTKAKMPRLCNLCEGLAVEAPFALTEP